MFPRGSRMSGGPWTRNRFRLIATVVVLGACGSPGQLDPSADLPTRPRWNIVVVEPADVTISVGDTLRLRVVRTNIDLVSHIVWETADTSRAVVDPLGLVTAKRVGPVGVRAIVYSFVGSAGTGATTVWIE